MILLFQAFIIASHGPDGHVTLGSTFDEDAAVFFLELLLKVVIQNRYIKRKLKFNKYCFYCNCIVFIAILYCLYRDRVSSIWPGVRDHIYALIMGASACDHHFLMERSVVGLLRLAIRLMPREDMSPVVSYS